MSSHDQYHHYIPRFILRRFQVEKGDEQGDKQTKNRKKIGQKKSQKADQEVIHYFDLETSKLELRSLSKAYGMTNLYKDVQKIENANHLEERLARLENDVALITKRMHDALESGRHFEIERRQLEDLRKFLFIMHYRKATISSSYSDEGHPRNAPITRWIEQVKQTMGIDDQVGVWLYFLNFFLNTSHKAIVSRYHELHGGIYDNSGFRPPVGGSLEDYPSSDYAILAENYFLGIVEAADDTEFILSNNGFGIWEGTFFGEVPGVHKLYVISPRIALLLRNNMCKDGFFAASVDSHLFDIPLSPAQVNYAGGKQFVVADRQDVARVHQKLTQHRLSSKGDRDVFNFRIIKLTIEQTLTVNKFIMLNVTERDAITFRSKDAMVDTLLMYKHVFHPFAFRNRDQFATLLSKLMQRDGDENQSGGLAHGTRSTSDLDIANILDGHPPFSSNYDRAYHIHKINSDDEEWMETITFLAHLTLDTIDMLPNSQRQANARGKARIDPSVKLVETLPEAESDKVMSRMRGLVPPGRRMFANPALDEVFHETAIIGVLHWLAMNRRDVLDMLFPDIPLIEPTNTSETTEGMYGVQSPPSSTVGCLGCSSEQERENKTNDLSMPPSSSGHTNVFEGRKINESSCKQEGGRRQDSSNKGAGFSSRDGPSRIPSPGTESQCGPVSSTKPAVSPDRQYTRPFMDQSTPPFEWMKQLHDPSDAIGLINLLGFSLAMVLGAYSCIYCFIVYWKENLITFIALIIMRRFVGRPLSY
ncbi:hypothetical protein AMATHDRAFT_66550 [Amanita thiersii Skay4041]|uniref:DUF4238 domain-containing protein n=1 Tax=Amanita thiersii Skay4041 TaxID=703135 RepID=A0A2A9NJN9_9AGAR|nr:hypothetical protein AMATHDRAFT_66550 [Amanita thiersii Skay4041]